VLLPSANRRLPSQGSPPDRIVDSSLTFTSSLVLATTLSPRCFPWCLHHLTHNLFRSLTEPHEKIAAFEGKFGLDSHYSTNPSLMKAGYQLMFPTPKILLALGFFYY